VMGVDPARYTDDIAAVVIKLTPRGREVVYASSWSRTEFEETARRIRKICRRFPIRYIAMDKGGGGDSVLDWLHKKSDGINESEYLWPIREQLDDIADLGLPGRNIVELVNFKSATAEMAHGLEADIANRHIMFPYKGDDILVREQYVKYHGIYEDLSDDQINEINNDLWGSDDIESNGNVIKQWGVFDEINEMINETCTIVRDITPNGVERFILPSISQQKEGLDMRRRDRFSALMLANYAAKVYKGHGHRPTKEMIRNNNNWSKSSRRIHRRGNVVY